jgi:hypothetical protein
MSEKLPKFMYSSSQLRACTSEKPNPQPLPDSGKGSKNQSLTQE